MKTNTSFAHTLDGGSIPPGVTLKALSDREMRQKNEGFQRNTVANFGLGGVR